MVESQEQRLEYLRQVIVDTSGVLGGLVVNHTVKGIHGDVPDAEMAKIIDQVVDAAIYNETTKARVRRQLRDRLLTRSSGDEGYPDPR